MTPSRNIKLTKRSVNSKLLFKHIDDNVRMLIEDLDIVWSNDFHRENMADCIDDMLHELKQNTGDITRWDVICDERNNSAVAMANDHYQLVVKYNQKNCLNVTQLVYNIIDE